jgi:hypothetical protein
MDKIDISEPNTLLALAVTFANYVKARNLEMDYGRYLHEQAVKEITEIDLLIEKIRKQRDAAEQLHEEIKQETKVTK